MGARRPKAAGQTRRLQFNAIRDGKSSNAPAAAARKIRDRQILGSL